MENEEKHSVFEEDTEEEEAGRGSRSSRAKNQTVMLTPEIAGQVRALLNKTEEIPTAAQGALERSRREVSAGPAESWARPGAKAEESFVRPSQGVFAEKEQAFVGHESQAPREAERAPQQTFTASHAGAGVERPVPPLHREASEPPIGAVSRPGEPKAKSGVRLLSSQAPTRIVGFLVSYDKDPNGEVCELRSGRWMLSSKPVNEGNFVLVEDPTISPLHAIIRVTEDGAVQVLDQLSEFGTAIVRAGSDEEEDIIGAMVSLDHGDVVRFGDRSFHLCLLSFGEFEEDDEEDR